VGVKQPPQSVELSRAAGSLIWSWRKQLARGEHDFIVTFVTTRGARVSYAWSLQHQGD
jgi:hypothetical protein